MKPTEIQLGMRVACGTATGIVKAIEVSQVCIQVEQTPFEIWTSCIHLYEIPTEAEIEARKREVTPWMETRETEPASKC